MLKTLEQQQTKRTPNNEPHAGETETTPAASEEDEIEEHNNVCELEAKKKSNSSPRRDLNSKDSAEQPQILQENGRKYKEALEQKGMPVFHTNAKSRSNSTEQPSKSSVKTESLEGKDTTVGVDANDIPSTSLDIHNSTIHIKTEKPSPIPAIHGNDSDGDADNADEPSLPGEEQSCSYDEQRNGEATINTPAVQLHVGTSLIDKVKVEEKSPLPLLRSDEEANQSPGEKMIEESAEEMSSSVLGEKLSDDHENVLSSIQEERKSPSPTDMDEEDRLSSSSSSSSSSVSSSSLSSSSSTCSVLKFSYDDKKEGNRDTGEQNDVDENGKLDEEDEPTSLANKIDEDIMRSPANATEDRVSTPPAKAASPVYKINDLSPASLPDDDESLQDVNAEIKTEKASPKLPKIECKSPMKIIKIESESEDEDMEIDAKSVNDLNDNVEDPPASTDNPNEAQIEQSDNLIKDKLAVETTPLPPLKVKINGAHAAMEVQEEEPMHVAEEKLENEGQQGKENEEEEHGLQQSVIVINNPESQVEPQPTRRRSSTSSSVSSTSQQLVIDQPESEQYIKEQREQQPEHTNDQQMFALKRRRSGSNSDSDATDKGTTKSTAKQRCVEDDQQAPQEPQQQPSSLLLQRLQAPAVNSSEMAPQVFSCLKCKANNFASLQQLNAHHARCIPQSVAEVPDTTPLAATTSAALPASKAVAPKAVTPLVAAVPVANQDVNPAATPAVKKERFFRCARCSTVHQCWNFFLHMREVHQRYICLYCSHVFASAEKLSLHLENKHDMDQRHFASIEAWQALQMLEDRARYLVCCNCQASFERGSQFDDHDCAELMQPCALCGQKATHASGCRNGSSNANTSNRKKTAARRRRKTAKSKPTPMQEKQMQVTTEPQLQQTKWPTAEMVVPQQPTIQQEINIPAPIEEAPQEDVPKLVVPKIMLRVPKEFQKSVDAALSSTDTEDEENDELPPSSGADQAGQGESEHPAAAASLLTVDAVEQQLPISSLSEDTETATETASTFQETAPTSTNVSAVGEQNAVAKLPEAVGLMWLNEFQRIKEQTYEFEQRLQKSLPQEIQQQQPQLPPKGKQRGRWSLTPPASPHNNQGNETTAMPTEQPLSEPEPPASELVPTAEATNPAPQRRDTLGSECMDLDDSLNEEQKTPQATELVDEQTPLEAETEKIVAPLPPADGIEVAGPDTHTVELQLDMPLDKFEVVDFVRLCLKSVYPFCLYCNHARRIAVNAQQLVLHLIAQHRFTATVDSITAEELQAETIVGKLKSYLPALEGDHYLNSVSCCSLDGGRFAQPFNERIYECFQCRFVTATHKELYTHNRRLHIKANIACSMCRLNFFSYSELLCHICPGSVASNVFDVRFRCCLCETAPLASAFRLMVHLRKQHQACDICLEDCHTQGKLSAHVWKHKLLHLCYRCGIAYRNKQDISKHLFWKHGTESSTCKRCLQKRWRHVYHFCVPATQFTCEQCQFTFSKAIYLEVHKRQHSGDFRYPCTEEQCEEKFVSRKLLLKHAAQHEVKPLPAAVKDVDDEQSKEGDQQLKLEKDEQRRLSVASKHAETDEQLKELKAEIDDEKSTEAPPQGDNKPAAKQVKDKSPQPAQQAEQQEQTPRKRRKKAKRNKASLEDLNLIAPNLSESDSSDDSDSDAERSTGTQQESHGTLPIRASVDDLDMPRVMLSPASESDNDEPQSEKPKEAIMMETEPKQEQQDSEKQAKEENELSDKEKPKLEDTDAEPQEVPDIWKNLLQNQGNTVAKKESKTAVEPTEEQLRPAKLHVAISDHDYCKMQRTPPPTPVPSPKKSSHATASKARNGNASSDSDSSSSSSSNSDSDSSSCSCGSNCSCSSSGSSSSDDDSDNESQSSRKSTKKVPKKSSERQQESNQSEEYVNVTSNNEEELRPAIPSPKAPYFNESDFDTAISDTDEEFYDAHPQRMANELLNQKRLALLSAHATTEQPQDGNRNYDIVENSRPSTPSLPEDASAFADKRERVAKNKKKKRERKSTCKSMNQAKLMANVSEIFQQRLMAASMAENIATPLLLQQQHQLQQDTIHQLQISQQQMEHPLLQQQQQHQQQQAQQQLLLPEQPHRPTWQPRMSEGSSCSDADGQLKRSKRTRRPNKFYGYTSDDENMSSVLAPPLQVGMQLIKPQPPPQLTWAKEDLPTPPKQQRSRSNHNSDHHHHQGHHHQQHNHNQQQSHSHSHSNGSARKRNKRASTGAATPGSAKRGAKRAKQQPKVEPLPAEVVEPAQPPIPTLKIRPGLLPVSAAPSDSSDSSSDEDESAEVNVTSLVPTKAPPVIPPQPPVLQAVPAPLPAPPPPPPATTAFNQPIPPALLPNPDFATLQYFKANNIRYPIRPPAGARLAREGESVYCYCRCPYDEVSEMIACDGDNCLIEWFHFECVGIMVAPQGKWFCAECRPKYSEGLYPGVKAK